MYSVYGTIINKDNTRTTVYNNRNTNTVEIPADNTAANSTPEVIPEMDIGTIVWTRKENGIIFKEPFYSDQIEGFLHYYKDNVVSASLDNSLKLSLLDPAKAKEVTGSQFTDAEQKELGRKAKIVHKNIPLPENIKDNLLAQALGADRDWSLKVDNKKDFYKYVALINIELSVLQIFKAFEKSITVPPKTPDRKTFIEGEWKKKIVPYLPFTFR